MKTQSVVFTRSCYYRQTDKQTPSET